MNCPSTHDWDLLAMEAFEERAAAPLLAHLKECPDCRGAYEQARRSHLDRIRMYDQLDRGHDSLREQLMAALPPQPACSRADRFVRGWRHTGDFVMSIKHKVGARATIGLVSAAACIGLVVLLMTFAGGKSAFAAAIEQFQKAKTIVCRISSPTPASVGTMTFETTGKLYFSAEYGSRCEMSFNGATAMIQYQPVQGPTTSVTPLTRTYTVVDSQAMDHGAPRDNGPDAFILALAKLKGQASRELGRKNLDGVEALGYEISGEMLALGHAEGVRSELWIDAKTYLPIRYVAEMPMAQIKGGLYQMVFDQFEWDTPLDPKLFVPEIPADYTRINATMPAPDEAALIKALGNYAELAGKYPPTMDISSIVTDLSAAIGARMASALARGEKAPDQQALMQKSVEIGSGFAFYQKLVQEGLSPEYHGETVSPGQADAVLLRWKLTDGQWRVIYGDLRVETINAQ
jgi:outer membrane lipoprotein-sorting protein